MEKTSNHARNAGGYCTCEQCKERAAFLRRERRTKLRGYPYRSEMVKYIAPTWGTQAACKNEQTTNFYPPENVIHINDRARRICMTCLVIDECLTYALTMKEPAGIWGGLTTRQRLRLGGDKISIATRVERARERRNNTTEEK